MRSIRILLWVTCMVACTAAAAGAADALRGVASRGVSAVTVGDAGRILYTWEAPHNDAWYGADWLLIGDLHAVTTTANGYTAVGVGGLVTRSVDATGYGSQWIAENSGTTDHLFGVTHAGDRLVAVGDSATVIWKRSQSQGEWTLVDSAGVPTRQVLRATAGNNSYTVAVGDSGTVLWTGSFNLGSWTAADVVPTDANLRGVALGPGAVPGRFWAVGEGGVILRSIPNGNEWESLGSPTSADLNAVAFDPGYIGIAVGDGGVILYSNGGDNWVIAETGELAADLYGVSYTGSGAGGGFVAVGDDNTILWSQFGLVWQEGVVATEETSWGKIRASWRSGSTSP